MPKVGSLRCHDPHARDPASLALGAGATEAGTCVCRFLTFARLYMRTVYGPATSTSRMSLGHGPRKQVRSAALSTGGVAPSARRSTASSRAISRPISRSPARGTSMPERCPRMRSGRLAVYLTCGILAHAFCPREKLLWWATAIPRKAEHRGFGAVNDWSGSLCDGFCLGARRLDTGQRSLGIVAAENILFD